jgi:phospholipase A1
MKRFRLSKVVQKSQASAGQLLGMLIAIFCLVGVASSASASDDKTKQSKPAKSKTRKQSGSPFGSHSSRGSGLAQEWAATNELKVYKQNYFMAFSHLSQPNVSPTSPNPANQVTTPYDIQNKEVKFQISLKHILADWEQAGTLWLGYTQLSFWQVYNQDTSQPFREIDYEPELIYSLRPNDSSILNFGANHQSIGQTNPSERSWNRVYIEPGIQFDLGADARLIVQIRWWAIIHEASLTDNPDIGDYQGYRELNLRYVQDGGWKVNVMSRIRSTQLDIAAPLSVWLLQPSEGTSGNNVDFHLQYFNGYGEGLLDYNQSHVTMGVGLSFPF